MLWNYFSIFSSDLELIFNYMKLSFDIWNGVNKRSLSRCSEKYFMSLAMQNYFDFIFKLCIFTKFFKWLLLIFNFFELVILKSKVFQRGISWVVKFLIKLLLFLNWLNMIPSRWFLVHFIKIFFKALFFFWGEKNPV